MAFQESSQVHFSNTLLLKMKTKHALMKLVILVSNQRTIAAYFFFIYLNITGIEQGVTGK